MEGKVEWLARMGKEDLVPQLLPMRWKARTQTDPVAQATAYIDARGKRRSAYSYGVLLLFGAVAAIGYFALAIKAQESLFGSGDGIPFWYAMIGALSLIVGIAAGIFGACLVLGTSYPLPAKDEAEAFAADMQSIEDWLQPANHIYDWRVGPANMRRHAEELLIRQACVYKIKQREQKNANNDNLKISLLVEVGEALNELHTRLSILNRHQLASLNPDDYLAQARKRLGQEEAVAMGLGRQEPAAEPAPSDTGLAELSDEVPPGAYRL